VGGAEGAEIERRRPMEGEKRQSLTREVVELNEEEADRSRFRVTHFDTLGKF
jgi:hypothetical protein